MTTRPFVTRLLSQTLVYWANPVSDGYGGQTFDDPVEVSGRCEYIEEKILMENGEEAVSKAHIYLDQVVREGEYFYLGELTDLDSAPIPSTTDGSMRVVAFSKTPALGSSTVMLTKAFLNKPFLNR